MIGRVTGRAIEHKRRLIGLGSLPRASDLMSPWSVVNVSVYPFGGGWWPFNPSVHLDPVDGVWRCLVRCANYTLPDGVPHLSPDARVGRAQTRNVLLELDPETLVPVSVAELRDPLALPVAPSCTSRGLEDLRLFRTASDGLVAVGCALQHNLERPNRPETVLCRLDGRRRSRSGVVGIGMEISSVKPIRGPWDFRPQKNWAPFDGTDEIRLLYSIERGVVMTEHGPAPGSPPPVMNKSHAPASRQVRSIGRISAEVRLFGRPVAVIEPQHALLEKRDELRGGSQLVQLADGRWLGVAHEMTFSRAGKSKFYWHTFYTLDQGGGLLERSPPMRLSGDHGIEFAAGLAIDQSGRLAVSYGTDDHEAWIATTTLSSVMAILEAVPKPVPVDSPGFGAVQVDAAGEGGTR